MRVLWTHNFDKADTPLSGVFMDVAQRALQDAGLSPDMLFLGNLRSPRRMLQARRMVAGVARHYDIIHAQFGSACAAVSVGHGPTTVVSLRGSDWTPAFSPSVQGRLHAKAATSMSRFAVPRSQGVVAVSRRIGDQVLDAFPHVDVRVAPDPVDLEQFHPADRDAMRAQLGLDPSRRYVLFTTLSATNPLKRAALARSAVEVARAAVPNVELLVATGRTHSQMPMLAAAADMALCTSTSEGWPNCIKEALACDRPFVATDVSDLRDIAAVDPRCKVVGDSPEALGAAIIEVLRDDSDRAGLRDHVAPMSMDAFTDQLVAFYRRLLG